MVQSKSLLTPLILATAVTALLGADRALAVNLYWDGTGTGWDSVASWSTEAAVPDVDPLAVPGSGDVAIFNISTVNTAQTVNLNAAQAAAGLTLNSTGALALLGGSGDQTLSLGSSGITMNAGAGALTIGSATAGQKVNLQLQGSQTWVNNSGTASASAMTIQNDVSLGVSGAATLTLGGNTGNTLINAINGSVGDGSGTLSLTVTGSAATRWFLAGANTYSGATLVSSGALRLTNGLALGSTAAGTTVNTGAGLFLENNITVVGEALTVNGDGPSTATSGAFQSISGINRWTGNITVNTGSGTGRIGAINSATLIVDGALNATGTGQLVFQTGGTGNSGTIIVNGNISFAGQRLTKSSTGSGTVILAGTNNYGDTIISSGVIQIGNGGTTGTLGTGTVSISSTANGGLAFKRSDDITVSNVLNGAGTVTQLGSGNVRLTGANNLTGATTLANGRLTLDFTGLTTPANIAGTGLLTLGGGSLSLLGHATLGSSQTFANTTLTAGHASVVIDSNGGAGTTLSLGLITRAVSGSTVNFTLPSVGSISARNANANGILGGWAVLEGRTWVVSGGDGTNAGPLAGLLDTAYSADFTLAGGNLDVPAGGASLSANPNSIRFNAAGANTLSLGGANRSVASGGILVTQNVGANTSIISGDTLTTGNGLDLIVHQYNLAGGLTISSALGSSLTKTGDGLLTLTGGNVAAIAVRINAGTVSTGAPGSLGSMGGTNVIVFTPGSTGTLQLTGNNTFNSSKGVTLTGNGIIDVPTVATLTGANSATGAGNLTKTGAGTLIFSAAANANNYTGATIIREGTLQINTLANGGVVSGLGASSSDAANLVLNGGTLRFASTMAVGSTDRLFTLGLAGGSLDASGGAGFTASFNNPGNIALPGLDAARTLTLTGTNTGANTLASRLTDNGTGASSVQKTGAGSWTIAASNSYSGGTTVAGGSLIGTVNQAFGTGSVTVLNTAINLTIQSGVLNAIADSATLSLAGDGLLDGFATAGFAFLASGVNETVGGLVLGGVAQLDFGATYGAAGSGATHVFDDFFQGSGVVTLAIPEPGSAVTLLSGLGLLVGLQRFRRRTGLRGPYR